MNNKIEAALLRALTVRFSTASSSLDELNREGLRMRKSGKKHRKQKVNRTVSRQGRAKSRSSHRFQQTDKNARKHSVLQNLLAAGRVQAHLRVGPVDDVYERNANKVADQVVGMNTPGTESDSHYEASPRKTSAGSTPVVRRMHGGARTSAKSSTLPGMSLNGGKPLSQKERNFFEPRFGSKFDQVRIHTDDAADMSARSIDARAYTAGNHIVMAKGEYNPDSREGKHLLAHELTHTIQQGGNTKMPGTARGNPGSPIQRSPKKKGSGTGNFLSLLRSVSSIKSVSKAGSALLVKLGQAGAGLFGASRIVHLAASHGLVEKLGDSREGTSFTISSKNKNALSSGLAQAYGGQKFTLSRTGELKMMGGKTAGSGSIQIQRQIIQRNPLAIPAGILYAMKMIGLLILATLIVIGFLLFLKWASEQLVDMDFTIPDTIPKRDERPVPDTRSRPEPRAEDKKKKKKKDSTKEKDDKKTDPSKDPDEDKKKKRPGHDGNTGGELGHMRFQVQWDTSGNNNNFSRPALALNDKGVTVSQAVSKLEEAWSSVEPRSAKIASAGAKNQQVAFIKSRPPAGVNGYHSWTRRFTYKKFTDARVDVVNDRGHNLRFP